MCKHERRQTLTKIALLRSKQRQTKLIFHVLSISLPIYEVGSRIFVPRALTSCENTTWRQARTKRFTRLHSTAANRRQRRRRRLLQRPQGGHESYSVYITRVLKELHPDIGITEKAMKIMDSFVQGLYEQLAVEASRVTKSLR